MSKIPPGDISYVLGYWRLSANAKHNAAHYQSILPRTLDQLTGSSLIVFHNDADFAARVTELAEKRHIRLLLRHRDIADLPHWQAAEDAVKACALMKLTDAEIHSPHRREKGKVHYARDFLGSGPETYRALQAIWLSKVALVQEISQDNPFQSQWFGWADASLGRFAGKRRHWDFASADFPAGRISHYGSIMRCHGKHLPLNASLLIGDADAWKRMQAAFDAAMAHCLKEPYGHDEETIIGSFYQEMPDLFHRLGLPYQRYGLMAGLYKRTDRMGL